MQGGHMAEPTVVSARPEMLRSAATLNRADRTAIENVITQLEQTGAAARRGCEPFRPDTSLPGAIRRLALHAMELDHGMVHVANNLDAADRRDAAAAIDADLRLRAAMAQIGASSADRKVFASVVAEDSTILRFDPTGDGRLVEVFGDLSTADHVVVFVPGMSNELSNVSRTRSNSKAILAAMQAAARPGERVAVVSWLGYDAPGTREVGRRRRARDGSQRLVTDVDLIKRLAPKGTHITVVAHSYGSRLAGEAMRNKGAALDVADVIVAGSPGMGVNDRKKLGQPATRLWALGAKRDYVSWAPRHGEDPASPGFGARQVPASGASGHSAYFKPGTGALTSIADVAVGRDPRPGMADARPRSQPVGAQIGAQKSP
jgi:hypothetical protein